MQLIFRCRYHMLHVHITLTNGFGCFSKMQALQLHWLPHSTGEAELATGTPGPLHTIQTCYTCSYETQKDSCQPFTDITEFNQTRSVA